MYQSHQMRTVDNVSRLFIVTSYGAALLALLFRIEVVAREAQRARETADMAVQMVMERK